MVLPISRIVQAAPGQCPAHGMQAPRIAPPNTRQGWNCSPPRNPGAAGIVGITHRTFMMIDQKKRRINTFQQLKQLLTQFIRCMMWPKRLHQHDDGGCFVQLCLSDFHWGLFLVSPESERYAYVPHRPDPGCGPNTAESRPGPWRHNGYFPDDPNGLSLY